MNTSRLNVAKVGVLTVKVSIVVTVPQSEVTVIGPVVAVAGTVASMVVLFRIVNRALNPLNVTLETSDKVTPVIVTVVPVGPDVGVKLVTENGAGSFRV